MIIISFTALGHVRLRHALSGVIRIPQHAPPTPALMCASRYFPARLNFENAVKVCTCLFLDELLILLLRGADPGEHSKCRLPVCIRERSHLRHGHAVLVNMLVSNPIITFYVFVHVAHAALTFRQETRHRHRLCREERAAITTHSQSIHLRGAVRACSALFAHLIPNLWSI